MTRFGYITAILAASVLAPACTNGQIQTSDGSTPPPGSTTGSENNTWNHSNGQISPWDLLQAIEVEGPPDFTAHMHGCVKPRYHTIGTILSSLGVNITNTTNLSAGALYTAGYDALGGPSYPNRIRENISLTTSGADKEFDIFSSAATEVEAAFTAGTIANCPGATMFNSDGSCNASGVNCLLADSAAPADAVQYCSITVTNASSTAIGQQMAVAAILAAAYTCE
jgi:hypothetical protein